MRIKSISIAIIAVLLSGCASVSFHAYDNDEYGMYKISDACAAGIPSRTLDFLKEEAVRFCAFRKEKVVEISTSTTIGIPMVRCADAAIKFKCDAK